MAIDTITNVPVGASTTFGNVVGQVNTNFQLIVDEVNRIETTTNEDISYLKKEIVGIQGSHELKKSDIIKEENDDEVSFKINTTRKHIHGCFKFFIENNNFPRVQMPIQWSPLTGKIMFLNSNGSGLPFVDDTWYYSSDMKFTAYADSGSNYIKITLCLKGDINTYDDFVAFITKNKFSVKYELY